MFKSLISVILFVSCFEAHAAVEDVISMQSTGDGSFSVICRTEDGMNFAMATADDVRANTVCEEAPIPQTPLKEGSYTPEQYYCPQKISWNGDKIEAQTYDGCSVLIVFTKSQDGSYMGKIVGYDITYRLTIKSDSSYFFETVDTGSSSMFNLDGKRISHRKGNTGSVVDPAMLK